MTPYMLLLVGHFKNMLESYLGADKTLQMLSKSFSWTMTVRLLMICTILDSDTNILVCWQDEKLRLISGPLVQQVLVRIALKQTMSKQVLIGSLDVLIDCLEDDSSVKAVNLALLVHTRSEDARVRLLALQCAVSMWRIHGVKLRGMIHCSHQLSPISFDKELKAG